MTGSPDDRVLRPSGSGMAGGVAVTVGSLVAAAGTYVFQVSSARLSDAVAFAPLGVLWTVQYVLFTTVHFSCETYLTRREGGGVASRSEREGLAAVVVATALLVLGGSWLARDALFAGDARYPVLAALSALGYGWYSLLRASLAASGRYRSFGALTALDSVVRLVMLGAVALAVTPTVLLLATLLPASVLAATGAVHLLTRRRSVTLRSSHGSTTPARRGADRSDGRAAPIRFVLVTALPTAAPQLLLAGAPVALAALGGSSQEVSAAFVTVTFARAPLVVGYGGLLTFALPRLSGEWAAVRSGRVLLVAGALVAACALAAAAGALVGPALVGLLAGDEFAASRAFTAIVAATIVLAGVAPLLNQLLIARRAEGRLQAPWAVSVALTGVVLVALPISALNVAVALLVGMASAVAGLAWTVSSERRRAGQPVL